MEEDRAVLPTDNSYILQKRAGEYISMKTCNLKPTPVKLHLLFHYVQLYMYIEN